MNKKTEFSRRILNFNNMQKAMSLMEILVSVAVIGLAFTLVSQMISQGTKNVGSSMWHSERLKESQLFFKMLREDLHKASDLITVDYTVTNPDQELTIAPAMLAYCCSASENFVDPFSNVNTPVNLSVAKSQANLQTIMKFPINKLTKSTSTGTSTGYKIVVQLTLQDGKLNYIRQLAPGSPAPTAEDDEALMPAPGKVVLSDVDFIHISSKAIHSQLNSSQEIGSLVNFFARIKAKDDDNKKAEFKQSIKTSIKCGDFSSGGIFW
ncbi:MAG TPA: hypothetical protein PK467_06735 [Candidatus Wallbacteria bacterium]|nr:hypothetical protein [Candidatus Wallbacteria bacterium]